MGVTIYGCNSETTSQKVREFGLDLRVFNSQADFEEECDKLGIDSKTIETLNTRLQKDRNKPRG